MSMPPPTLCPEDNSMAMKKNELPAITTVEGVRGYIDANNVAQLNVEDVARGLGFTRNESELLPPTLRLEAGAS